MFQKRQVKWGTEQDNTIMTIIVTTIITITTTTARKRNRKRKKKNDLNLGIHYTSYTPLHRRKANQSKAKKRKVNTSKAVSPPPPAHAHTSAHTSADIMPHVWTKSVTTNKSDSQTRKMVLSIILGTTAHAILQYYSNTVLQIDGANHPSNQRKDIIHANGPYLPNCMYCTVPDLICFLPRVNQFN